MKIEWVLKFARDEFIYGGHLLALGAASVVFTSAILLNVPITWDFLLVVYLIFYIIYFYNRFRETENDFLTNPERTQYFEKYIKYVPFVVSCSILVIVGILFHFGSFLNLVFGLLVLLSGLFYSLFLKKITGKIVGFKSFYVSFVWALLVIFLISYYSFPLDMAVVFIFIFIFLRLLVNTIFFDIKDIESDKKNVLKTIPILLGKRKVLNYLHIINIISFVPIIVGIHKDFLPVFCLPFIFLSFYSFYYLRKAENKKINIRSLSYIMVDGEYLFWLAILFLTRPIV